MARFILVLIINVDGINEKRCRKLYKTRFMLIQTYFFYINLNKLTVLKFFENLNCSLIVDVITQIRFVV
jgi:hypothetical protein